MSAVKACWKCKQTKTIESFANNRSKSSGKSAECRACVKAYNKTHVEQNAAYYQEYRKAKRAKDLAWYLFLEARTRAKRQGLQFSLLPQDVQIPASCPVFGFQLSSSKRDTSASLDRKDSSKGYIRGNVWVISYLANRMKSNATELQLVQFAQWILENFDDSARRLDTRKGEATHSDYSAGKARAGSCTWQGGNDENAIERSDGAIAQDIARLVFH